ncbi:MAG: ATP synthase subunit I [Gemmatimonadota bacterium]|nr:ATP synthase subunit I [Gemmatimonadota bacterium]
MRDLLAFAGVFVVGAGLGAVFFGGLWWTVRKAVSSRVPALWFAGSLIVRTGLVLSGLYFVSGGDWKRLVVCLVGFFAARMAMTRIVLSSGALDRAAVRGAQHAP